MNNTVAIDLKNKIDIHDSETLRSSIANLVDQISAGGVVSGTAGAGGILFGSDQNPENIVDTFSKVAIHLPINDFVPKIKSTMKQVLNSKSSMPKMNTTITKVDLDVMDETTLVNDISATVTGLAGDFYINIPYIQTVVLWDSKDFIFTKINHLLFKDNTLTTSVLLGFPGKDKSVAQEFMDIVGNVIFHRAMPKIQNMITVTSIGFGPAPQLYVKTFSTARAVLGVDDQVQGTFKYVNDTRPLELADIQAMVIQEGILAPLSLKPFGIPLNMKFSSLDAKLTWQRAGKPEYTIVNSHCDSFDLANLDNPSLDLLLIPDLDEETGIVNAIVEDLGPLLSFKDFARDAFLGYIKLNGSNGKTFYPFSFSRIEAPELVLWNPITVNVLPSWPISGQGTELPIKTGISFANLGPLHLDCGTIDLEITDGGESKPILKIMTPGDLVVRNVLEGGGANGGAGNPTHGEFHVVFPFRDLNPLTLLQLIYDLLAKKDNFSIKARFLRNGLDIKWAEMLVHQISLRRPLNELAPVIGLLLAHIKFEVVGLDVTQTFIYKQIIKFIEKWLHDNAPGIESNINFGANSTIASPPAAVNGTLFARGFSDDFSGIRILGY